MRRIVSGLGRRARCRENGQILIMSLMLLVLLLGFGAIVVDGGFYLQRRERIQHITDAAALAGVQELPEDDGQARLVAEQWADRNGLSADDIDVSFECRAGSPCDPSGYNTIIVTGEMRAPLTLMPVLRLVGASGNSCWLNDGCTVTGTAAAEAISGTAPTDIVLVLDRTGSMDDGDMDLAKDGARAMLGVLDPELQSVGLAVLPPSQSQSFDGVCRPDQNDPWTTGDDWLVSVLADDYQDPDGSLNNSSRLIRIINCLQSDGYTNIGYPVRAAYLHLINDGRSTANKAIVLLSDGAANRPEDDDPCALAAGWTDTAKADGVEIYTIGYGTDDNQGTGFTCENDTGFWNGQTAETLLRYMATDDEHFFQEPEGSDLEDVFEEIGQRLAEGYRLVD